MDERVSSDRNGRRVTMSGRDEALVVEAISHGFSPTGGGRFTRPGQPVPVLDEVSFTVAPGTLTALVGPSGCGKSTLLRILAGLDVPSSGTARLAGHSLIGQPGSVAYHPQRDALLPWLRALDNATLGAVVSGRDQADARKDALELLTRFGLSDAQGAWPDELSGGMRQRVALLRTFLMPQPVLLLDEPFAALDALTRRHLHLWLLGITTEDRRPTLLVTHDIDEALLLADRVIVLSPRPARIVHIEERPDPDARAREHAEGTTHAAERRILKALRLDL